MTEGNPPPTDPTEGKDSPAASTPRSGEAEVVPPERNEPDWETRFKYLLADFENYRKRSDREREGVRLRERADLLRGLLPIHEALDRARHSLSKVPKNDPVRKGLELVARELDEFLDRSGVEPVATVGRPFDSAEHEAVVEAPPTPKSPDGTVLEIVQQGYRFPGGLLRAAKVVVARTPSEPPAPNTPPAVAGTVEDGGEERVAGSGGKD